jgi:hypothetical protein
MSGNVVAETQQIKEQGLARLEELCRYLLPAGKKDGTHWRCGNVNGDKGKSFDVNLATGQFGDWADNEKMRTGAINLWMEVKNVDFNTARTQLTEKLGIQLSQPKASGPNGVFKWSECVKAIEDSDALRELQKWRGLSPEFCEWMVSRKLIGLIYGSIAFPIYDKDGGVSSPHYVKIRTKDWLYFKGTHVSPLIIGNIKDAQEIHIHESTWDGLTFADRAEAYRSPDVCVVITRGANHAKTLQGIIPPGRRVYVWPQNDKPDMRTGKVASEEWFETVKETLECSFHRVQTPLEFEDLNDWTRNRATKADLIDSIADATLVEIDDGDDTEWFDLDSLFKFDRENDPDNVIGNRWICRGDSFILQGYTGIGKSSFLLQMGIYLALGRPIFGCIIVDRPLKILIIQAENNAGDMAEPLQDICEYLKLSDEEKQKLKKNLIMGRQATKSGAAKFSSYVRSLICKHKPDMCLFDPLLSYFGKDIYSQEDASEFFRIHLQPIQNETGVIMGFVHHLGKPPKSGDQRQGPILYAGLGSSDIFNWAREVMTLMPDEDCHKLDLGKRGFRAGIVDDKGQPVTEIRVQRASDRRCYWSVADSQPKAGDRNKKGVDMGKALEQVPLVEPELKTTVITKIHLACKVGVNPARDALAELIMSGKVEDVDIENPNKKRRALAGVVRTRRETS